MTFEEWWDSVVCIAKTMSPKGIARLAYENGHLDGNVDATAAERERIVSNLRQWVHSEYDTLAERDRESLADSLIEEVTREAGDE